MRDDSGMNRNILTSEFTRAAKDYYLLLQRSYPERGVLPLIGDRYSLNGIQRTILYRGIFPRKEAAARKKRRIRSITGGSLLIDYLNVLFTVSNYLYGRTLFLANDGFLRDTGENHDMIPNPEILRKAAEFILLFVNELKPARAVFIIDEPVFQRLDPLSPIPEIITSSNSNNEVLLVPVADRELMERNRGILATSDSVIIDKSDLPVFDLPFHLLKNRFHPRFIKVSRILTSRKGSQ